MNDFAVANKNIVPVRRDPDEKSEYIDELLLGMVVEILWEDKNDFLFINTKYNYKGYVNKKDLIVDETSVNNWIDKSNIIVIGSYIDITQGTAYNTPVILSAVRGSHLISCNEEISKRTKVMLPDGRVGWIRSNNIKKKEKLDFEKDEDIIRDNIVKTALSYLGTQFRWGGKSSLGVDSSGFTCMVYLLNNIIIWRDSDFKEGYFKEISIDELKKGDLIYFPEHTAIYIGNNKFIHSSGVDSGVIISSLNPEDNDYKETLAATILKGASCFRSNTIEFYLQNNNNDFGMKN